MESDTSITRFKFLFFGIYAIFLFIFLSHWGVIETSEARYAEIAREMLTSGDWLHPRLLNIFHYHKPPGTYWITALSYELFGVNSFAVRFFLQAGILIQIVLVYKIAQHLFEQDQISLLAAVIYGSMPLVLIAARGLTTDCYLTTVVLLILFSWLNWRANGKAIWLYAIGLEIGGGFLIKGPLIFIVPFFFFIGISPTQTYRPVQFHHVIAILLSLIIALSWYLYLIDENRNFLSYFLIRQTADRVTNADVFKRHEPFWYYFAYGPLLAFPWSIPFIAGLLKAPWANLIPTVQRLLIWCVGVPLLLFSLISSKLVLYVLPIFPIIAICTSYLLVYHLNALRMERIMFIYFTLLCIVLGFVFLSPMNWQWDLIIIPAISFVLLIFLKANKMARPENKVMGYAFVFTIMLVTYSSRLMSYNELKVNSTKPLSDWIIENEPREQIIIVYNRLLPSLSFHLQRPIISLNHGNHLLDRETGFEYGEKWKQELFYLHSREDSLRAVNLLSRPSLLVSKGELPPSAEWIREKYKRKQEINGWYIYRN
jgi:4-amino-4-deoxy-L-arabinose transferase-like glycosyltransferase